jgi:rubrerythrin
MRMELDEMCKNAVRLAAERERDLLEFYKHLAPMMRRKAIKDVFTSFKKDIGSHVDELEALAGKDATCDLLAHELEKEKAPPELGISRYLKDIELSEASDYQEVLIVAMKHQERMVDFLSSIAAMTPVEEVAGIFRAIRNDEATRLRRLEEIYEDEILKEG